MSQSDKAKAFAALHKKGDPVILYNIWDPGSARAVAEAGAKALATGSWPVSAAQGFADGEKLPLMTVVDIVKAIIAAIELPLSVDFEGAYAMEPHMAAANVGKIIDAGAVGINFEDQVVGGAGLHGIDLQAERIKAIRGMADGRNMPFFINARTDLFLKEANGAKHGALMEEAKLRGRAYAQAGASGFFAPGLTDVALINELCDALPVPVNILMKPGAPDVATLAKVGVARISHGPFPYRAMTAWLQGEARKALAGA